MKKRKIQKKWKSGFKIKKKPKIPKSKNKIIINLTRTCINNEKYAKICWSFIETILLHYHYGNLDLAVGETNAICLKVTRYLEWLSNKFNFFNLDDRPFFDYSNKEYIKCIEEVLLFEPIFKTKYLELLFKMDKEDKLSILDEKDKLNILDENGFKLCDFFGREAHLEKYIIKKILEGDTCYDKRTNEIENLNTINDNQEPLFLCGQPIPLEIVRHICSFIKKDKETLDKIGIMSEILYISMLLTWDEIKITDYNIYNIPIFVLSNVCSIIIVNEYLDTIKIKYLEKVLKTNHNIIKMTIYCGPKYFIDRFNGCFPNLEFLVFYHSNSIDETKIKCIKLKDKDCKFDEGFWYDLEYIKPIYADKNGRAEYIEKNTEKGIGFCGNSLYHYKKGFSDIKKMFPKLKNFQTNIGHVLPGYDHMLSKYVKNLIFVKDRDYFDNSHFLSQLICKENVVNVTKLSIYMKTYIKDLPFAIIMLRLFKNLERVKFVFAECALLNRFVLEFILIRPIIILSKKIKTIKIKRFRTDIESLRKHHDTTNLCETIDICEHVYESVWEKKKHVYKIPVKILNKKENETANLLKKSLPGLPKDTKLIITKKLCGCYSSCNCDRRKIIV